jgi:hemoglobin-like flavoprotein
MTPEQKALVRDTWRKVTVTDSHYGSVGATLLWTLEQGLGSEWTPEVKAAWNEAYSLLAGVMRGAALRRIA